jgi:hypothetical protein
MLLRREVESGRCGSPKPVEGEISNGKDLPGRPSMK